MSFSETSIESLGLAEFLKGRTQLGAGAEDVGRAVDARKAQWDSKVSKHRGKFKIAVVVLLLIAAICSGLDASGQAQDEEKCADHNNVMSIVSVSAVTIAMAVALFAL